MDASFDQYRDKEEGRNGHKIVCESWLYGDIVAVVFRREETLNNKNETAR